MVRFKRLAMVLAMAAAAVTAQPALTTIQDVLYRADGTRFSGTMFIRWNSFMAADTSNIATAIVTLPIVNGVLSVKLVPTTTATPGAQYSVTYNSQGRIQFSETWAVPPSALVLRVRDVRIGTGSVVGPPPITSSPIQIGDVVGLTNALGVRPQQGVGFAIGRAAVINQAGQIEGAVGNLGDCVRVDGTAGPCGGGGGGFGSLFSDGETPAGVEDGSNVAFTLRFAPSPAGSLDLYRNGLLMAQGVDYTLAANSIHFFLRSTPQPGDVVVASYRYANPNDPLSSLTSPQVVCSGTGTSTSSTTLVQLASCTLPAGLVGTGDRIEVRFQYAHTGNTVGFTPEIHWGATTALSRGAAASETAVSGLLAFGIYVGAQSFDTQSWGGALAFAAGVGNATENSSVNLTVSFQGKMAAGTAETVVLRNFTVIHYPAQSNP
ncbi:MAG TPA: hypothetical protein VGR73_12690 [Bryobacteraceae bacterium]|nr:hypothetical protein [Bryobacteraceae bacterium]